MFSVSRLKNAALEGLGKLFPAAPAAPTAKTPGFQPVGNPSALSHVVNTLAPDAAQRPMSAKPPAKTPPGTVFVPASATASAKGDARVAQRAVVLSAVNRYYHDKGYDFSHAAIEEAAARLELDGAKLELTHLRDAKGGMALTPDRKPIMGYYVTLTPEGATTAKNAELVREADNALDAFIPEAKRITELGTPSVTDKTQTERFEMLRQAYARRYGPDAAQRLAESFTSLENMGVLIGGTMLMGTPAAPLVMAAGGYGMAKETVELAGMSRDIGKALSVAECPSDIEKLAPQLNELVQRTALLTVNTVASGGLSKGANLAKTGVTTGLPSATAVVTPEGMIFPAPSQLPVKPTGGGSPLPTIVDAAPTGLPNVTHPPGMTPAENFGGPAAPPEAMQSKGVRSGSGGGNAYEIKVRAERPELKAENFVKVIDGDKLTQAKGMTHQNAADHIGFVREKSGLHTVQVSEITTGNKDVAHLAKQLEGATGIASQDKQLGHLIRKFEYRVFTDNPELIKALAKKGNKLDIGNIRSQSIIVIDTRNVRR